MKPQQKNPAWDLLIHLKEHQLELTEKVATAGTFVFEIPPQLRTGGLSGIDSLLFSKDPYTKDSGNTLVLTSPDGRLWQAAGNVGDEIKQLFAIYLPYIFLAGLAVRSGRCRLVSHFAVSLDGRIATESGHSKWIGCKENIIHAHRMRSLCDGILVGRYTFERDNPKLTVREVKGNNPARIILGNVEEVASMDPAEAPVIVARMLNGHALPEVTSPGVDSVAGKDIDDILVKLYEKGIHTVYLEGGSRTSSSLLESGHIDILQMHYAPILMGSGIAAWQTKSINEVTQALTFTDYKYQNIGDGLMFTGWPDYVSRQNGKYSR